MTKKSLKFEIVDEIFLKEMRIYLPYFNGDTAPSNKLKNFSNLMASFYNVKIFDHKVTTIWEGMIFEGIKKNKFRHQLKEMHSEFFQKISAQLKEENQFTWQIHANAIASSEMELSDFEDFDKFKEIFANSSYEFNVVNLKKLQKIKIPNNKTAMKLISRFLVNFFMNGDISGSALAALISMLPSQVKPELDKNLLRAEFHEVVCLKLFQLCAECKETDSKTFEEAKRYSNEDDFSDIDEFDINNGEIIGEDGDGGYLILIKKHNLNESIILKNINEAKLMM